MAPRSKATRHRCTASGARTSCCHSRSTRWISTPSATSRCICSIISAPPTMRRPPSSRPDSTSFWSSWPTASTVPCASSTSSRPKSAPASAPHSTTPTPGAPPASPSSTTSSPVPASARRRAPSRRPMGASSPTPDWWTVHTPWPTHSINAECGPATTSFSSCRAAPTSSPRSSAPGFAAPPTSPSTRPHPTGACSPSPKTAPRPA